MGFFGKKKQMVHRSGLQAVGVVEPGRPSRIQEAGWWEFYPALQCRPLACDTSAVSRHNLLLAFFSFFHHKVPIVLRGLRFSPVAVSE